MSETHAERPLITRSRSEVEGRVIKAARVLVRDCPMITGNDLYSLLKAVTALDEWTEQRAAREQSQEPQP